MRGLEKNYLKRICAGVTFLFFLFFIQGVFSAFASDELSWKETKTRYTILRYQTLEDLIEFSKKINYSPGASGLGWLTHGSSSRSLEDRLKAKIDAIFQRVQQILDMRRKIEMVHIDLYQNKGQLSDAFKGLYHKECRLRAWYAFEKHTIYLNLEDLHEGMLAHEMAHAIIDHYFAMRPPSATAEILARYVDSHLLPR